GQILGNVGTGYGLTKAGPGTLTINSAAVSNISGELNVAAGKVQIGFPGAAAINDFVTGGLASADPSTIVENSSNQARWIYVVRHTHESFGGTVQDRPRAGSGARRGLNKSGTGSLTLSGNNTLSDTIT